ncbi:hypothetical protein AVEN_50960-1 [Araneus ventricosus]|uniref:BTB domain-containing protein n=1 Tax=Araneus ventricosus TaxID=182803 RepID=A0A4Y2L8P2_ARAVE|nr:hypothetical protein AVEN_50960-1 [Araneus ventricosus]
MECLSEEFRPIHDMDIFSDCNENEVHFKFSIFQLVYQSNCIFYPELLQPEEDPTPWQLDLNCSRPSSQTDLMRLQFNLLRTDKQMYSVQMDMDVQVFNCVQIKILEHSFKSVFTAKSKFFDCPSSLTFFMWLRSKLFINEDLGVEIYIRIRDIASNEIQMPKSHIKRLSDEHCRSVLQTDFKHAFENRNFTDVELKGADGSAFAHKFVLSCRSSIFQKVLKEAEGTKVISMPKRTKIDLELFLEYLYTGSISTTNIDSLVALYIMALDYEVLSLRNIVRDILITQISLENASKVLNLAIDFKDKILKRETMSFGIQCPYLAAKIND